MSQLKLTKATAAATPAANKLTVYYDSADSLPKIKDESGNVLILGTPVSATPATTYRWVKRTYIAQGTTTFSKQNGTVVLHVRGWGAGGGGAGCAASTAANIALSVGGGGGAYSEVVLTSLTGPFTCVVGLGGAGGTLGANDGVDGTATTFLDNGVLKLEAKGGSKGTTAASLANGLTVVTTGGSGAGGVAASGTGDTKFSGGQGDIGIRLSGAIGMSGTGGNAACGAQGGSRVVASSTGVTGMFVGGGGGGALSSAGAAGQAGGAGANGLLIVDEYA